MVADSISGPLHSLYIPPCIFRVLFIVVLDFVLSLNPGSSPMKANTISLFFLVGLVSIGSLSPANEPMTLIDHADRISSLAFSPDSKLLVSSSHDGSVRFLDAGSGKEIAAVKMGALVHDVAFSPSGKLLAVALVGSHAAILDVATRKRVRLLEGHKKYVLHVAFSRDGKTLVTTDARGAIRLWNTDKWTVDKTLISPSRARILAIDLSADGKWLAAGTGNAAAHVWDLRSGELEFSIMATDKPKHKSHQGDVAFSPDSKRLATTSDFILGGVRIYDVGKPDTPIARYFIPWTASGWSGVAFTPNGKELACATGYWYVSLVKSEQQKQTEGKLAPHTYAEPMLWARDQRGDFFVQHIAVSPNGKKLAYAAHTRYTKDLKADYFIQLWDVSDFRKAARAKR